MLQFVSLPVPSIEVRRGECDSDALVIWHHAWQESGQEKESTAPGSRKEGQMILNTGPALEEPCSHSAHSFSCLCRAPVISDCANNTQNPHNVHNGALGHYPLL